MLFHQFFECAKRPSHLFYLKCRIFFHLRSPQSDCHSLLCDNMKNTLWIVIHVFNSWWAFIRAHWTVRTSSNKSQSFVDLPIGSNYKSGEHGRTQVFAPYSFVFVHPCLRPPKNFDGSLIWVKIVNILSHSGDEYQN